jgi:ADP-ribose pyrophosphatase YjhB (NUDIX family)
VIAVADGRLLLNLRAIDPGKGSWSFPSGYVDLGETPESAAIREVKEETGFDVALDGLVGVYSSPNRPVVFIVYSGSVVGGEATGCDEVEAVGYFDPANLPPLAFDHDTRIIGDWQRGTGRRRVTTGGNG